MGIMELRDSGPANPNSSRCNGSRVEPSVASSGWISETGLGMHEDFGCDLTLHVGIWEFETGHRRYSNKEEHPYSAQDLLNPINPIAP